MDVASSFTPQNLIAAGGLSLLDESATMKEAAKRKRRKVQIALCGEWGRRRRAGGDMGLTGVPRLTQQTSLTHTGHAGSGCLGGVSVTMLVTHGTPARCSNATDN